MPRKSVQKYYKYLNCANISKYFLVDCIFFRTFARFFVQNRKLETRNVKLETFTYNSGLRLVHRESESDVAYVGIAVRAGTRDEEPRLNGLAHYVEHCVFKGCTTTRGKKRTARQIINNIEGIGGEINAFTTKEETTFYAATPIEHFRQTLDLIADMVLRPTFPKHETDKELGVILDEIESYEDSPSELIYDDFEALLFRGNSLAQPILGKRKTLKTISSKPDYAANWVKQHFTPDRMVVFSQGKIPFAKVQKMVEKLNIQPKANVSVSSRLGLEESQGENTQVFHRHTHQVHVMLGGKAYPLGHKDQLGAYFLNNILGGGSLNSRLNLRLREQKGLVYTIESQYVPLSDTGYWNVYFACEPQHKDECIALVKDELQKLRNVCLTDAQHMLALKQLRGQMAISAENQENSVLAMAKQMMYYGCAPSWQESYAKIAQFTPTDLQRIAREIFDEKSLFTLIYE